MKLFRDKSGWDKHGWYHFTAPKPWTWRKVLILSLITNGLWAVIIYIVYKLYTR